MANIIIGASPARTHVHTAQSPALEIMEVNCFLLSKTFEDAGLSLLPAHLGAPQPRQLGAGVAKAILQYWHRIYQC